MWMVLAFSAVIITFQTSNLLPGNLEGIRMPKGESTFPDTGSPVGRTTKPHHGGTAISWLRLALLSWLGQGCLEQLTSLGSAAGQLLKKKQKRHLCHYSQSRPLGKDQRTCLSALSTPPPPTPRPQTQLSDPPQPLGTGEGQRPRHRETRYVMPGVKALKECCLVAMKWR